MTKQTRLKHYKILLDAYETYEKNHEYLSEGFCWATKMIIGNRKIYDDFRSQYPELYKQRPETMWSDYCWWEQGYRKPRIEALKKAIELCKAK